MNNKRNTWIWILAAFIAGVLACQLFYSVSDNIDNEQIARDIDQLRQENLKTHQELDKLDSLLNLIPGPENQDD